MSTDVRQQALPRSFHYWLAAASLSTFGDVALYFALGWAATGLGPGLAGLVLTCFVIPRAVLLILAGVLGDRWGPRRVMIACDALLCGLTLGLAGVIAIAGISPAALLITALLVGGVEAFYLPASGAFPRLFATDEQLPRAMALRGTTSQVITLAGGPVAGLLVAAVGLTGALLADSLTFAICLVVVLLIRPPFSAAPPAGPAVSLLASARDGLRTAWSDPMLRAILVAVGLVAAFVLPVLSLCLPLLARAHGWGPATAGLLAGSSTAGSLLVTVVIARRGTFRRAGLVTGLAPLVIAVGTAGLAVAGRPPAAMATAFVLGSGIGLFTAHMGPLFVTATPRSHLIRLQSLLGLVQTLPLLVANSLIGALSARTSPQWAVAGCAVATTLAAIAVLSSRQLRAIGTRSQQIGETALVSGPAGATGSGAGMS
ncbi:MFS transporter [Kribbella deserti]|uniref:MFS transporter n=1 Tax=Kribbella deserti TaxID=1926257 RepID=A0ABV6QJC3_9ACTN